MINFILALALSLRSSMLQCDATVEDGLNAADFATLCVIERKSSEKLSEAYPKITVPSTTIDEIREIVAATTNAKNISSVPAGDLPDEAAASESACKQETTKQDDCKKHWAKWRGVKKAAAQRNPPKFKTLTDSQRINPAATGFIVALHDLEEQTTTFYEQLLQQAAGGANPDKSPAATKLTNAKYGEGKTKVQGAPGTGHGGGSSRGNGCKHPHEDAGLVHDLFCLCVTGTTSKGKTTCGFAVTNCNSGNWEACTVTNKQSVWATVETKCREIYKGETTAQRITAGLAAFAGRLQRDAAADIESEAAVYLGASDSKKCTANATKLCVDYSAALRDKTRTAGIYWYKQLDAAADDIDTLAKEQADLKNKIRGLYGPNIQARQPYKIIAATETQATTPSSAGTNSQNENTEEKQKECENIKKSTECKNNVNCKREGGEASEGKHCKLNEREASEQVIQAGGTGTTQASSDCKDKQQKECTEDSECKWEGKECKDSSFLVGKKLALSMASALVSSLF